MQLMRLGPPSAERPAVRTDDGTVYDLTPLTDDNDGRFLAGDGIARTRRAINAGELPAIADGEWRIGAPVARPGMIVCIGLNYRDHAEETGQRPPDEPVIFMKAPNTVVGPYDDVLIPRGSTKTDWEVELAVIIGKRAQYLDSPRAAADVVAGFSISHDVSEREFQLERGGQWVKGKSCETFNPLGPWLVPAEDVADVGGLPLRLWVNGVLRQNGSTADLIFDVNYLVWYLSQFMVLDPGDVVNTGTPAGVALGQPDKPFLRDGDDVRLEIEGLGYQHQTVRQA